MTPAEMAKIELPGGHTLEDVFLDWKLLTGSEESVRAMILVLNARITEKQHGYG